MLNAHEIKELGLAPQPSPALVIESCKLHLDVARREYRGKLSQFVLSYQAFHDVWYRGLGVVWENSLLPFYVSRTKNVFNGNVWFKHHGPHVYIFEPTVMALTERPDVEGVKVILTRDIA